MAIQKISFNFWLTLISLACLTFTFFTFLDAEIKTNLANEQRYQSVILALRLYRTTYDQTRTLREYIGTTDETYLRQHEEILKIRSGISPVPSCLLYWELVSDNNPLPCKLNAPQSDLTKIANLNFTKAEISKYKEAVTNLNMLSIMDDRVIFIMNAKPLTDKDQLAALRLAQGSEYNAQKQRVIVPVHNFLNMVEARTTHRVDDALKYAGFAKNIFILFMFATLFMLGKMYRVSRSLLGADIDVIHENLMALGSGNFEPIKVHTQPNTIMRWLEETQKQIYKIDLRRQEVLQQNIKLTMLYSGLSQCRQSIARSKNELQLFSEICANAIIYSNFSLSWVGIIVDGRIIPIAHYGEGREYLDDLLISLDPESEFSKGPSGISVIEDHPVWCQDFLNSDITSAWHARGSLYNWNSSCSLPIHKNGKVYGVFTLYCKTINAFDNASQNLLTEMVTDIDITLTNFEREIALTESRNFIKTIMDTAPISIFWKDVDSKYIGCNQQFADDAKLSSVDDIMGKTDYDLCWREHAQKFIADDLMVIETGESKLSYDEQATDCDGKLMWLRVSKVPLRDKNNAIIGMLGIYDNITEHKQNSEQIYNLANFDVLTGLPNRTQLNERLKYAINLAKRKDFQVCIMFLDIDHFKNINDSLGHAIGDNFLRSLSKRFLSVLREDDTVTRIGGDEFIFLFTDADTQGAAVIAQKLLDSVAIPFQIDTLDIYATASIGIAFYPGDGEDLDALAKNADSAMYRVKQSGRQNYCFFTQEMQETTIEKFEYTKRIT